MRTLQCLVTAYSVWHQFVAFGALVNGTGRFMCIFSEKRAVGIVNTDALSFSRAFNIRVKYYCWKGACYGKSESHRLATRINLYYLQNISS